ncbi:MAG: glycosyl transferase family 25 [Phenylobacterium sp.]|jgi:glycosyl transferase family 25
MSKINQCPVYVVNLDDSPQRMETMNQQLVAFNVAYERISAVKGVDLSPEQIQQEYAPDLNKSHFRADLSLGEIGCYMSHRNIWRKMVAENVEFAVVLEDDMVIEDNFPALFADIEQLKQYDLIKLADNRDHPPEQTKQISDNFELVSFKKIPNCTTGYTINLSGAKKLLSRDKFYRPVDIDLQFCSELALSVLGVRPYPITENKEFTSDIAALNGGHHGIKSTSFLRNMKYRINLWWLRKRHVSAILKP